MIECVPRCCFSPALDDCSFVFDFVDAQLKRKNKKIVYTFLAYACIATIIISGLTFKGYDFPPSTCEILHFLL